MALSAPPNSNLHDNSRRNPPSGIEMLNSSSYLNVKSLRVEAEVTTKTTSHTYNIHGGATIITKSQPFAIKEDDLEHPGPHPKGPKRSPMFTKWILSPFRRMRDSFRGESAMPNSDSGERIRQKPVPFGEFQGDPSLETLKGLTIPEVYVSTMLGSGKGLACWKPETRGRLVGSRGATVGDVGIFNPKAGGFTALFNLWDDEQPIQRTATKIRYRTPYTIRRTKIDINVDELREGEAICSGMSRRGIGFSSDGSGVEWFEFGYRKPSPGGAVLAMTSAAELEELSETSTMRDHIVEYAELIYRHADSIQRISDKEALYIVSGSIKSETWALGAFKEPMPDEDSTLRLVSYRGKDSGMPREYRWTHAGTCETRHSRSGGDGSKDQTLFLRGFKLDISKTFRHRAKWSKLNSHPLQNPNGPDSSDPSAGRSNDLRDGRTQNTGERESEGSSSTGFATSGQARSHTQGLDVAPLEDGGLAGNSTDRQFSLALSTTLHPCDLINEWLLHKTGADFALCHDEDWISDLKEGPDLLGEGDLDGAKVPEPSGQSVFSVQKGVAILLPREDPPGLGSSTEYVAGPSHSLGSPTRGIALDSVSERGPEEVSHSQYALDRSNPPPKAASPSTSAAEPRLPLRVKDKLPKTTAEHTGLRGPVDQGTVSASSGIVILLMGQTGAGKSHFINSAAGTDRARVDHGLITNEFGVRSYTVNNPKINDPANLRSRVVLVDTPGLNNTNKKHTDLEIIKKIGTWLNDRCSGDLWVGGIIFLHDITEDRATVYTDDHAWPVKYFESPALLQHIVLTTGKWNLPFVQADRPYFLEREQKLKNTEAWRKLLNRGAGLCQYEGDYESAWTAINTLLAMPALRMSLVRKDFNGIQRRIPELRSPRAGFWRRFKNLFSRG